MNLELQYDSPSALSRFLDEQGLHMTKRFGQNFLISPAARERIIGALEPEEEGAIWEIGPGLGAMTHMILRSYPKADLSVFEIDHGFCRVLNELFSTYQRFTLIEGDVLKRLPTTFQQNGVPSRIFGNLPYNIGSVCIAQAIELRCLPRIMVFTLQKEVIARMLATPSTKAYSGFTLLCAADYTATHVMDLNPGNFFPQPDVVSSVVRMDRRERPLIPEDAWDIFHALIHDCFSSRRKNIRNNLLHGQGRLQSMIGREIVEEALGIGIIDGSARGETLSIQQVQEIVLRLRTYRQAD